MCGDDGYYLDPNVGLVEAAGSQPEKTAAIAMLEPAQSAA